MSRALLPILSSFDAKRFRKDTVMFIDIVASYFDYSKIVLKTLCSTSVLKTIMQRA